MEEIIYVPVGQKNKNREKQQIELISDYMNAGWDNLGKLFLKDSMNNTVNVILLQKKR